MPKPENSTPPQDGVPPRQEAAPSPNLKSGILIRNALWLFFDRGFRFIVLFLTSVAVTRYLGPSASGALHQAIATAAILAGLCDLGLDTVIRVEVIKRPDESKVILASAATLRLISACVLIPLFMGILVMSTDEPLPWGLICGIGLTVAWPVGLVFDSWFQSQTQARYSVWSQNLGLTAGAVLRLIGIYSRWSLSWFGWVAAIEMLVAGALLCIAFHRKSVRSRKWEFDRVIATRLLVAAWPLALTNLAILIYTKIDLILLATQRTQAEAGIYAAALRITETSYILPMILVNTLFPLLTRLHLENYDQFSRALLRLLVVTAWGGTATALVLAGCATWLIPFIYGPLFSAAATVLMITAANAIFAGLGAVRSVWLLLHGFQKYGLYYVGAGAGVSLVLNALLIPRLGTTGAAIASVSTQAFVLLVAPLFFSATRRSVGLLLSGFHPKNLHLIIPTRTP